MKNNNNFKEKWQYKFDNLMSRGPIAMIGLLALASLVVILFIGLLMWIFKVPNNDGESMNFIESTWQSMMATLDPGTMGGDSPWAFRILRFLVTLGGIFIISTLIGVLGSGIQDKLEELRKGRSTVLESGHTLILGWSPKIFYIINELVIANESQKRGVIVVLSNTDKVTMEEEIKQKCPNLRTTTVICRSGNVTDILDLKIGNPNLAKSIIILTNDEAENPDSQTIKTILAITNHPERKEEEFHIVAEIQDPKNAAVAKMVGKNELEVILSDDVISSIMVQTCRHSGLSEVFTELLDYDGDEIYFTEEKSLTSKTFYEAMNHYDTSTVIGIARQNDTILLNPSPETVLLEEDQLILIASDDSEIHLSTIKPIVQKEYIASLPTAQPAAEKIIMLGWNKRGQMVLEKMDDFLAPGSIIKLVATNTAEDYHLEEIQSKSKNIKLEFQQGDITNRELLDQLDLAQYNQIFLMSYSDEMSEQNADSHTLIALLHIRDIANIQGKQFSVASEMMDINNRELAKITKANDFIVSENYISLILSQVSENKYLNNVFKTLFTSEGSEINIKPVTYYVQTDKPMSFYTVMESAMLKGEIAIGYKKSAEKNVEKTQYGVYLNPKKSDTYSFAIDDKIIVLSQS